jgi:hypothetical protein
MLPPAAGKPVLKLIQKFDSGQITVREQSHIEEFSPAMHHVFANETALGGTTDYAIHLWHQVISPQPLHPDPWQPGLRQDRWYNLTFVPYQTREFVKQQDDPICPY